MLANKKAAGWQNDDTDLTDKTDFFPPQAEKDEPKVSHNPF